MVLLPQITSHRKSQELIDNTSQPTVDQTLSPPSGNETISNTLNQRLRDDLLSPDNSYCEKEVFEVTLEKQKPHGIGITIVGGDSSSKQDVGLFVKSVTNNGPAFLDGRIKPGDRIIAINDESVEGKEHHEAVKIIKYSKGHVKLLIAQIKPPGSIRKRDYDEEVFQTKLRESNIRHNKDEELSSSRENVDHSSDIPVITVRTPSVHSRVENNEKRNKNTENDMTKSTKNTADAPDSIPGLRDEIEDQEHGNSTTVDIHSTLSQVDSLHSEMAISDIPADEIQDVTEVYSESSDTDSDFDTAVNDVIENRATNHLENQPTEVHQSPRREKVLSPITETVEIILQKKNGSFGLNVTGGVTTTVKHGGIYVKSLIENGSAAEEGTVRKGDRILEVNDVQLTGFTHKQAVETLVNAPEISRLLLERPVQTAHQQKPVQNPSIGRLKDDLASRDSPTAGVEVHEMSPGSTVNEEDLQEMVTSVQEVFDEQLDCYPFQNEENTYTVELKKGTYGLGFSLLGSEVEADPTYSVVRIKRVFPIGPAANSKLIQPGDVIISINGGDIKDLTHIETMGVIRRAGKTVTLVMCHPDPEVLPPIQNMESYESLEVTPTSSTSHISDDDDDDSDSDIEVTPRREALITPPTGFAPSPYPVDVDGSILPKVASPPPPLPVSPPPVLINTGEVEPSVELSEEFEIEIPELNESCNSEIVYLQNAKLNLQEPSYNSLVVREDSALTVSSRDLTPTVGYPEDISRESTPYTVESVSTTPVNVLEGDSTLTPRDCDRSTSELDQIESPGDTVDESFGTNTLDSFGNYLQTSQQSQDVEQSDSDSGSNSALSKSNKSTSYSNDKLESTQNDTEVLDNTLQSSYTLIYDTVDTVDSEVFLDTDRNSRDKETDYSLGDTGVSDNVNIDKYKDESVQDESESDYSDDNEEFDDTLKRLEEKYKELNDDARSDDDIEEERHRTDIADSSDENINNDDNNEQDNEMNKDAERNEQDNEINKDAEINEQDDEIDKNNDELNDEFINQFIEKFIADDVNDDENDDDSEEEEDDDTEQEEEVKEDRSEFEDSVVDSVSERDFPSLPLQPGDIEVTLTKPEGRGLGFTVTGGASTTGGCYVKAVLQNPALSDGTLKPGDKLIMVNGIDVRSFSHFDAVSVLREASNEVTLRVHRESSVGDTRQAGVVKPSYTDGLTETAQTITSQDEEDKQGNPERPDEEVDSESEKEDLLDDLEEDKSSASEGADDMQCIQDLIESLTATDTHLEPTDQPVARRELERVSDDKTSQNSERSPSSSDMSVYQIDLHKPATGGLGISLVSTETQNQTGVFIRTITPGGVADQDGRLKVGDKILQINGESLVGMNHTKAATILRLSHGKLSLTVSRSQNKKLLWMQPRDRESEEESCKTFNISHDDSSLSITKHVPDDLDDTGVDELVAEAERILGENVVNLDQEVDQSVSSFDFEGGNRKHEQSRAAHKYLGASEVIEYTPDEIYLDTEHSDNTADSDKDIHSIESDLDAQIVNLPKHQNEMDDSKYIWSNLRNLDIEIPDEVTSVWLSNLPLVTISEDFKSVIPGIVSELRKRIAINDPQQEFKQLRIVHSSDECTDASLEHNKLKNRFRNVLPYNTNRVKISDDIETDYINASHIQYEIDGTMCDYIVCQGPLPDTTDDFWEMIWQQEVTVVAMLTLDMESMKVKCHRYWPDSTDTPLEVCNRKYRLSLLYWNGLDDFDIRHILMEDMKSGESRCIYHVNYTTWPDHGTPASAVPILQCLRLCHLLRSTGPLTVHCSAGIGRSGTFITIDLALAHVEKEQKFNIPEIVAELRRQRQGMIQTRDQYLFCYTACLECLELEPSP